MKVILLANGEMDISALAAVASAIVAVIAVAIALRQVATANDHLRLDLFDKRYEVYRAAIELLSKMDGMGEGVSSLDIATYSAKSHAKFFLLDERLRDYLNTIFEKAQNHRQLTEWLRRTDSEHPDFNEKYTALEKIEKWAGEQFMDNAELRRRFAPYLDFSAVQLDSF